MPQQEYSSHLLCRHRESPSEVLSSFCLSLVASIPSWNNDSSAFCNFSFPDPFISGKRMWFDVIFENSMSCPFNTPDSRMRFWMSFSDIKREIKHIADKSLLHSGLKQLELLIWLTCSVGILGKCLWTGYPMMCELCRASRQDLVWKGLCSVSQALFQTQDVRHHSFYKKSYFSAADYLRLQPFSLINKFIFRENTPISQICV